MRLAGSSDEDINGAKNSPYWSPLKTIAPTIAYDAAALGDGHPPAERLKKITQPTLVATGGGHDPHTKGLQPNFFGYAADAIAKILPRAARQTIENEGHVADPKVLGKLLEQFFKPK